MCQRVSSLLAKGPNFSLVSSSVIVYLTALVIYVFALRILFVNFVSFFVSILFFSCTLGGMVLLSCYILHHHIILILFCLYFPYSFLSSIFPSLLLTIFQICRHAVKQAVLTLAVIWSRDLFDKPSRVKQCLRALSSATSLWPGPEMAAMNRY